MKPHCVCYILYICVGCGTLCSAALSICVVSARGSYQFIIICKPNYGDTSKYGENGSTEVSAIDLRRSFIISLNERISKLDRELSYAQKLAYERERDLKKVKWILKLINFVIKR